MRHSKPLILALLLAAGAIGAAAVLGPRADAAETKKSGIAWQSWSKQVFERAKAENRFVLLDLEAIWCHWCHVMDETTYADPAVIGVLKKHYIAVKVDQDSRPDLANRYEQYGWPATIIFGPDGTEIVKRRGYLEPELLKSILVGVVEDPSPVPGIQVELPKEYAEKGTFSKEVQAQIDAQHREYLDTKQGGLLGNYRYVPWDALEYALVLANQGDEEQRRWAEQTLTASLKLIDPVWGGAFQYSVQQSWDHPHYEKIMQYQSETLRTYALARSVWQNEVPESGAADIKRFVKDFLTSPEGAFYTSQDADVVQGKESDAYYKLDAKQRKAKGIPRVDRNRYARENGWMIEALALAYEQFGKPEDLASAEKAARWVIAKRSLEGGGFRHGENDKSDRGGPFLGDTLAMGRAFLQLYRVTGQREWLERASSAAVFIDKNFRRADAGYTSAHGDGTPIDALPQFDENLRLARFANLLNHYTGKPAEREIAEHALRYPATPSVWKERTEVGGVILADREFAGDPLHLTIVGAKTDKAARSLYEAALHLPGWYKRVEWWDRAEGPLPNADVPYPTLERAAAFVCTDRTCSRPLFAAEDISRYVDRDRKPKEAASTTPAP